MDTQGLAFEQEIIKLFEHFNIPYQFNADDHFLASDKINIRFIPCCSLALYKIVSSPEETYAIRLWEDVFLQYRDIVKSRIVSLIGQSNRIYARLTRIKEIRKTDYDKFLQQNHLNSKTTAKYRYGMYYKDRLQAVAGFGRSCPIQQEGVTYRSHEIIRFCSLLELTVVGGLSKFINHFIRSVHPEHLMTYVDREWSEGKSYQKLGFKIMGSTMPQEFWLSTTECERWPITANTGVEGKLVKIKNIGNIKLTKIII